MKHLVAPSILAADFSKLAEEVEMINRSEADWIHIDVMDGHFVPNISFGFPILKAIRRHTNKFLDVHLMMSNPDKYIEEFKKAGADSISVHFEACIHLNKTIETIKKAGAKAGVVLNPHTPVSSLKEIIELVDLVLIMSVNPGFGGQKFIPHTFPKIKDLVSLIQQQNCNPLIEIDGGVNLDNAGELIDAGVNVLVAGSSVFKSDNPIETISKLKNIKANNILV